MNKILKINIKDIVYDYRNASDMVIKACNRQFLMEVKGGFLRGYNIILTLEQVANEDSLQYGEYVFAPFADITESGIMGEITSRYYAGFSTIMCFEIEDKNWGLFAKRKKNF